MSAAKPAAATVLPWLRANLGPRCLAALTATDRRALLAAVQIAELTAFDDNTEIEEAFGIVVLRMQRSTWHLAYHAIAHALDWSDRARLWRAAGLGRPPENADTCRYEPASRAAGE